MKAMLFVAMLPAAVIRATPPDETTSASPLVLTEMRCEYLREPLGIDTPRPQFGWRLADPRHFRGQRPTAWQIVVEGSATGSPALPWDSGKVVSDESVHVTCDGAPLRTNMDCRWRARVWDKDGQTSASLYGPIVSKWRRSGPTAVFDIEVPVNTTAKVIIPATSPEDVREGDHRAAFVPGSINFQRQPAAALNRGSVQPRPSIFQPSR